MRVLVANRGEIAVRVMRACRELGYPTVAVYSEADRAALHVLYADQAMPIGPPPSRESYLSIERILDAAKKSGAEAIHPGYGFLAENADFAAACVDAGLIFIGPSADSIRAMGSKVESRQRMKVAGVPIVPGLENPVRSYAELRDFARSSGYPVMVKASAGGGGKGLRQVDHERDLESAFERVRSEAASFFGDDAVYAEKTVVSPRHIEVQVLGDQYGHVIHLGERECTLQRRHQKVLEESPSPVVDAALRERLGEAAVRAAKAVDYYSAGTIEFLMDPDRHFYFLEMNTRLQVEHPVTEQVMGVDLVKEQLRIAQGGKLHMKQEDVRPRGHAIECRIYAEDPAKNFMPSPGTISRLTVPEGPGVRLEIGVAEGVQVSVHYDPLLAKLITRGATREEALARMQAALDGFVVEGIRTVIPFHRRVLESAAFRAGRVHTQMVEQGAFNA